jgi:hypothetical protein
MKPPKMKMILAASRCRLPSRPSPTLATTSTPTQPNRRQRPTVRRKQAVPRVRRPLIYRHSPSESFRTPRTGDVQGRAACYRQPSHVQRGTLRIWSTLQRWRGPATQCVTHTACDRRLPSPEPGVLHMLPQHGHQAARSRELREPIAKACRPQDEKVAPRRTRLATRPLLAAHDLHQGASWRSCSSEEVIVNAPATLPRAICCRVY